METFKVILCEECGACPSVEIEADEVRIGEDDNVVRLTHEQWNDLVRKIHSGELGTI